MRKKLAVLLAATLALGSISFPAYAADADYDSVEWEVVGEADVEEGEDQGYDEDVYVGDSYDEGDFIDIEVDEETWEDAETLGEETPGEETPVRSVFTTKTFDDTKDVLWTWDGTTLTAAYWLNVTDYYQWTLKGKTYADEACTTEASKTNPGVTVPEEQGYENPRSVEMTATATVLERKLADDEDAEWETNSYKEPFISGYFQYMIGAFTAEDDDKTKVQEQFKVYEALPTDDMVTASKPIIGYEITKYPTCTKPGSKLVNIEYYMMPGKTLSAGQPSDWKDVLAYDDSEATTETINPGGHDWYVVDEFNVTQIDRDNLWLYDKRGDSWCGYQFVDFEEKDWSLAVSVGWNYDEDDYYTIDYEPFDVDGDPINDNNVFLDDEGNPCLIDESRSGVYYTVSELGCKNEENTLALSVVKHLIEKTDGNYWVNDVDNIYGYLDVAEEAGYWYFVPLYNGSELVEDLPEDDLIVLENCTKKGEYTKTANITLPSDDCIENPIIGRGSYDDKEKVTVPAHDTEIVFLTVDPSLVNTKKITVTYNGITLKNNALKSSKDESDTDYWFFPASELENIVVANNMCYQKTSYDVTTTCFNKNYVPTNTCKYKPVTETVEVDKGTHHILSEAQKMFLDDIEDGILLHLGTDPRFEPVPADRNTNYYYRQYDEKTRTSQIISLPQDVEGISFNGDNSGHDHDGSVNVKFFCPLCATEVEEIEVPVAAHRAQENVKKVKEEELVPASCTEEGVILRYTTCDICGEPVTYSTVNIPMLAHIPMEPPLFELVADNTVVARDNISRPGDSWQAEHEWLLQNFRDYGTENQWSLGMDFVEDGGLATIGRVGYRISGFAQVNCAVCGEVIEDTDLGWDDAEDILDDIEIYVTNLEAEDTNTDTEGTITILMQYFADDAVIAEKEITAPYWSDWYAFLKHGNTDPEELKNGLVLDADGVWRYYIGGKFQENYNGIVRYNGGSFFVANGVLCKDANGLNLNSADKKWYFLSQGQVQTSYTGLAEYDGQWFSIQGGVLDESVEGLVPYNGGSFLFSAGRLRKDVSGLWGADTNGDFWYLAKGQAQTQYTGLAEYDGSWFYVMGGKWANKFNGTVVYDGVKFKVVNGQVYQAA